MIQQNKCAVCKQVYEISWDDDAIKYFNGVEDDIDSDRGFDIDEGRPVFCPFCGTHGEYCEDEEYAWN